MQQNPYAAPSPASYSQRPDDPNLTPEDWTIGSALGAGWDAFKNSPFMMMGALLASALSFYVVTLGATGLIVQLGQVNLVPFNPGAGAEWFEEALLFMATFVLIMVLILLPLQAFLITGWFRFCLAAARQEELSLGLLFSGARRILPVVLAMLVLNIVVTLASMALIVPGIILALGFAMTTPLLADTEIGTWDAFSESWVAMRGHKFMLFLFSLIACFFIFVGTLPLGLGLLVVIPVFNVAFCEIYVCVTGRRNATGV